MNPPALGNVLPFRCPPDRWKNPTKLNEPAPADAWEMASMSMQTVRPGSGEHRIELVQGVL
jgi:hypothetical protein